MTQPFDAVLIVSFGGPNGLDDIRPFLANVLRGRRVPPHRVEEVAHHYEHFDGVSPITELTMRQASGLKDRLKQRGYDLPVYVGMRNWHPYLADTLKQMSDAGVRRAIGFITSAHHSYSGCGQYKENVADARKAIVEQGCDDIDITYVDSWFDHPDFIAAAAGHVADAIDTLDSNLRDAARVVFTAHSLPIPMADSCAYVDQLSTTCRLVAEQLGRSNWTLVYQSRSGRPQDPWLEPDVCDYLKAERDSLKAAVLMPIGFVCDHIEVLWDLDEEAAEVCRELELPMARAETVNADPRFIEMMAKVVQAKLDQHQSFPPLPIVSK